MANRGFSQRRFREFDIETKNYYSASCAPTVDICKFFYNVNKIVVRPSYRQRYLQFLEQLDIYLRKEYRGYYAGLQAYEYAETANTFYIVASYLDVPGIEKKAQEAGDYVSNAYDKAFGSNVIRTSVFSFLTSPRVFCLLRDKNNFK